MGSYSKILYSVLILVLVYIISNIIYNIYKTSKSHKLNYNDLNLRLHNNFDKSKPTILMIHGFPDTSKLWSEYIKEFQEKYNICTCDLPNFDPTRNIKHKSYLLNDITNCINEYISKVLKCKVILFGHDWGSGLGFISYLEAPENYSKIVRKSLRPSLNQLL